MTSDEVTRTLLAAAGAGPPGEESEQAKQAGEGRAQLTESLGRLAMQIAELKQTSEAQVTGIEENTKATLENTAVKGQGPGSAVASTIGRVLTGIGSTLTLSPVIGGLVKLFGGGDDEEPVALPEYVPPPSIRAEGAPGLAGSLDVEAIRYGSDGLPTRIPSNPAPAAGPAITIQVQAIDSRSFLDHSDSIAQAVREAMLNMHGLNDVIGEL